MFWCVARQPAPGAFRPAEMASPRDVIEIAADGLGTLRNGVRDEGVVMAAMTEADVEAAGEALFQPNVTACRQR